MENRLLNLNKNILPAASVCARISNDTCTYVHDKIDFTMAENTHTVSSFLSFSFSLTHTNIRMHSLSLLLSLSLSLFFPVSAIPFNQPLSLSTFSPFFCFVCSFSSFRYWIRESLANAMKRSEV